MGNVGVGQGAGQRIAVYQRVQGQGLHGCGAAFLPNGFGGQTLVVLHPADQLQILLVYDADPMGRAALWPHLTGDLHHIVRSQAVNGVAVWHAQDHGAGLAALGVFYEFQRHTGVAAVIFFVNINARAGCVSRRSRWPYNCPLAYRTIY